MLMIAVPTTVLAGMDVYDMFLARRIELADLFLLFIYTEINWNGWCIFC